MLPGNNNSQTAHTAHAPTHNHDVTRITKCLDFFIFFEAVKNKTESNWNWNRIISYTLVEVVPARRLSRSILYSCYSFNLFISIVCYCSVLPGNILYTKQYNTQWSRDSLLQF